MNREQRGVLRSWDDKKGFGFIHPQASQELVFAHISVVRGRRRPQAGDGVMYVLDKDQKGRLAASHVRLADELALDDPAIRQKVRGHNPVTHKQSSLRQRKTDTARIRLLLPKTLLWLLLCVMPFAGTWQLYQCLGLAAALWVYPVMSLLCFFIYWHDKSRAQNGGWRTPEKTLHAVELLGGWPGALIAQQLFRHKTRKWSYQSVFWLIVLLHQVMWCDWLFLGAQLLQYLRATVGV